MINTSTNDKGSSIIFDREKINIRGKMTSFTSIEINKLKIVIKGKYIRIAEVREDWDQDVVDPDLIINSLKKLDVRIDLFTFIQRLPESRPQYNYNMEWDSVAAIPIISHEYWLRNQIPSQVRNKIKIANKSGVAVQKIVFGEDLVKGISSIYNETPIRQGTKNTHYNMDYELVKKLNGTFLDRCDFIGAFYDNELIGYLKIVYTDKYARVMGILGKVKHQSKSIMNLLLSKAVEICAEKKVPFFVYAKYDYGRVGSDSLKEFKKSNGFENILIPRYYIPLNTYGKMIVKLKLYRGIKNILPRWFVRKLLKARTTFNEIRYSKDSKREINQ